MKLSDELGNVCTALDEGAKSDDDTELPEVLWVIQSGIEKLERRIAELEALSNMRPQSIKEAFTALRFMIDEAVVGCDLTHAIAHLRNGGKGVFIARIVSRHLKSRR